MRLCPGIRAGPYIRTQPSKFVCKIYLKISILMVVGHLNSLIWPFWFIFWSLDQLVIETLGVAFVRTYVRPCVRSSVRHTVSRKPLITFLWNFHFPEIFTYDVIFAPKMTPLSPFSPKMTYFDQTYAIKDIFDKISVQKPDWNNF